MSRFDCDEVGVLNKYIGCKLDWNKEQGTMKVTQHVLWQSLKDEFGISKEQRPLTPAKPGSILCMDKDTEIMKEWDQKIYGSGVGKLLHMMKSLRPEISNAVRELSIFMKMATLAHMKAMRRVMSYIIATPEQGLLLEPNAKWDRNPEFKFEVSGQSD